MILSHRHRFIFVKTKRTAGTSLEIALSALCGPEDVITPITAPDEADRRRLGYRGPQNLRPPPRSPGRRLVDLARRRKAPRFRNHMPAARIRALLPRSTWDTYFKFCFDRNPWDRAISLYYWLGGQRRFDSIADFLRSGVERPLSNFDRYAIDGRVAVDRVFRYEDMEEALGQISRRLDLARPLTLPDQRAKGTSRTDRRPYRDVLTEEERDLIADLCAREIRLLGYEY
ncbi:MAG TPA: sulfotransferase family 2 domain-containing protein [Gemmatimonadota bacterium]|nr:sulfotransferase family 2 domain-containing protein [Gemmatimonadota bacterium]